ncbi:MAG: polyphosphate kinase 1 [Ignavibacteriaceae bacterium]|nr:polyphosphate kinase 1 [Ignavibacteria bacterium]NNJ53413.1 polyphosphate kinase 1 [Ignavibacteriaceae bacterium]
MVKQKYFNRELSWLSFNHRVLQEAKDKSVPLFERLKFLAIYSSNLDEFFRVRVASLRSLLALKDTTQKKLEFNPRLLLKKILDAVHLQQEEFGKIFREEIIPELESENIYLVDDKSVLHIHKEFISNYFRDQVVPFIQPIILDKNKIVTFLHNRSIYFALRLLPKQKKKSISPRYKYAIVEIPADRLCRFVKLPSDKDKNYIIFLDDIIRLHLNDLLPGYKVESCYSIKLTRDAELYIDDEFTGDLLLKIQKGLAKRKTAAPSRFLYEAKMPDDFLKYLRTSLQLDRNDLIPGGRYHNFNDFFTFPMLLININKPHLENESMPPLPSKDLEGVVSVFDVISEKDVMLSFPYQSFAYIVKFLEEAADDVNVNSIKITLYRVADESLIVRSLVKAAENGKKVTAFVEIKARFDEESNFSSANALKKAGVKVFFSFPGLKVHSKLCLIERTENNKSRYYTYLATGNFNEKTTRIYCDHALLTANQQFGKDAARIFNFLERKKDKVKAKELLVAPFKMRKSFTKLIDNEIQNAKEGKPAEVIIKVNSLEDRKTINKLYVASNSGVKVKIIVRGICCLVPGIKGLSENIEVISIVDRFLEHARIFIFHNGGNKKYFLSSADWMKRNLSRRIEVAFPVYDKEIQIQLQKFIDIQSSDNMKARVIDKDQKNEYLKEESEKKTRSQFEIYRYIKKLN